MKLQFVRKYFGANEWKQFARDIRVQGGLLRSLSKYPDSILVTGCQRSGTTLVTRLLAQSPEINDIWVSKDDEYDAAMILSGSHNTEAAGRFCFQTTYLNESYIEYIENKDLPFQLIWVVRNPVPVVNSMLYNWGRYPLNELYEACGEKYLDEYSNQYHFTKNIFTGLNAVEKACLAYVGKQKQLLEIYRHFSKDNLLVINYESITGSPMDSVPELFRFARLEYKEEFIKIIKPKGNVDKDVRNKNIIEAICMDTYQQARKFATI